MNALHVLHKLLPAMCGLLHQLQQWNDAQLHLKSAGLRETVLRAQKGELLQEEYKLNRQLVGDVSQTRSCFDTIFLTLA